MWLTNHKQLKPKYPVTRNTLRLECFRGTIVGSVKQVWNGRKYKKIIVS